ncbi:MAG TPA: AraC family transcriptional regulator [Spirochaetota bacterium]|nr:AraC family transcriptional regulator [Spirochaetota bacterium]
MYKNLVYEKLTIPHGRLVHLENLHWTEGKNYQTFTHFHELSEIILYTKIRGKTTIDDESYQIHNNTLVYVPPLAVHDAFYIDRDKKWLILQFMPEILNQLKIEDPNDLLSHGFVKDLSDAQTQRLIMLMHWYLEIFKAEGKADLRSALFRTIVSWLLDIMKRSDLKSAPGKKAGGRHQFKALLKLLESQKIFNISLEEAANTMGITKFHFSRIFKRYFKQNFNDYLRQRKIMYAMTLLTESNHSVSEIAKMSGFNDTAYFSKIFKKYIHQTPRNFRKSIFLKR